MPLTYIEQVNSNLKQRGYRISKLRDTLIKILDLADEPASVPDLLSEINSKHGLLPNKTSIYRELDTLLKAGIIHEVDFGEGKKRYELLSSGPHPHLICKNCGSVKCVKLNTTIESWLDSFCEQNKFALQNYMLEFFGICQNCQSTHSN